MYGQKSDNLCAVLKYLPDKLSSVLNRIEKNKVEDLMEIRLRTNLPVVLVFADEMAFITSSGRITQYLSGDVLKINEDEIKNVFLKMCKFSVYSQIENISDGFITIDNGCRVGAYGTAVVKTGQISSVRNIKGLNIRIAGHILSVADKIADLFTNRPVNTLICGPPLSGKTTILKDLCRTLSDKFNYRVSVVDERHEFDGMFLGVNTDVLSGYPKKDGIMISVRTLSPQIIICDELGDCYEVKAVLDGLNCGVNFVMTLHCSSYDELKEKSQYRLLCQSCLPDYCIFLKSRGVVESIIKTKVCNDENFCVDSFVPDKHTLRSICGT